MAVVVHGSGGPVGDSWAGVWSFPATFIYSHTQQTALCTIQRNSQCSEILQLTLEGKPLPDFLHLRRTIEHLYSRFFGFLVQFRDCQ